MNDFLPHLPELLNGLLSGLGYFLPELALTGLFVLLIFGDLFFFRKASYLPLFWISLAGILLVTVLSFLQLGIVGQRIFLFHNMIVLDRVSVGFKLIFGIVSCLFLIFVRNNRPLLQHKKGLGDLFMLLAAIQFGLHLMAMAASFLMVFISIEMVSIGSYLLVGYVAGDQKQTEAAMKYVLFGSVCSAVMLYGMSLLYAYTGSFNPFDPVFSANVVKVSPTAAIVGIGLVLTGIGFKLAFVPFHFWSPDVYEGAPTPVTAFLSTGPKVAGFAILIHFLQAMGTSLNGNVADGLNLNASIGIIALVTMIAGNFPAIWQNNAKRLIAYSSIGHTGFVLIGVLNLSQVSLTSILFYLLIYSLMNMAAFMLVDKIESVTGTVKISEYSGLGKELKIEMFCFVVILLSLTGLPPTGGFIAKFLIFSSALDLYTSSRSILILLLLAVGAITTVVSLFYYFKVPLNAYLRSLKAPVVGYRPDFTTYLIGFLTALLVVFGIFPSIVVDFIGNSILIF